MTTKILLVEDDLIVGKGLQAFLKKHNIGSLQVVSGEEALEVVAEYLPDLIFMDIKLKGKLNGIETAHRIRAKFSLPLIFITELMDSGTFSSACEALPYNYITKPISNEDLLRAIDLALLQWKHANTKNRG